MDVMKVAKGGVDGGGERGEREMGKRREGDGERVLHDRESKVKKTTTRGNAEIQGNKLGYLRGVKKDG